MPVPIGSCEYDAETLLGLLPPEMCQAPFFPAGQSCALPLNAGPYGDQDPNGSMTVDLPDVPLILRPFINGNIDIKAQVKDAGGAQLICLQGTLDIHTSA